jgi:hypothetical protein
MQNSTVAHIGQSVICNQRKKIMSETKKTDAAEANNESGVEEVETAPSEGGEELNLEELADVAGGQARHHHHPHHAKHHAHHAKHNVHHATAHHAKPAHHTHHAHHAPHHTAHHNTLHGAVPRLPGIKK